MTLSVENRVRENYPVVGIGASLGGLHAIVELVSAIPVSSGMSYVIATHQSKEYAAILDEVTCASKIPVTEIINDIFFEPDHIYILPQRHTIREEEGKLVLYRMTREDFRDTPIDILFESLAKIQKSFSVGVILSGESFDGTVGLKKLKEAGGATIAQDPNTAAFPEMPQNACDGDAADYIAKPSDIPEILFRIRDSFEINNAYNEEALISKSDANAIKQIIKLIFIRSGRDYSSYRQTTIRRRIARRMVICKIETLDQYLSFLRFDKNEQEILAESCLIPVTYFFRDLRVFTYFSEKIVPNLVKNAKNNLIRIWIAGCSSGEEAYSIAICLHEYISSIKSDVNVKIFASDLSEHWISKARTAIYSKQDVQDVIPERLKKYFTRKDGHYQINREIREMCVFAVHNLTKDQPFAKMDLVSCRNVLIYFDNLLQQKVLQSFDYALEDDGILMLGLSESTGTAESFDPILRNIRIYRKKKSNDDAVEHQSKRTAKVLERYKKMNETSRTEDDFSKMASSIFLKYAPAGVIVDEQNDILHFQGDTSPFLLPTTGKPNFNLLKMARPEIDFELRGALIKGRNGESSVVENIEVKGMDYSASIEVHPIYNEKKVVVIFRKQNIKVTKIKASPTDLQQKKINRLELEMDQWRENMRRSTEEREIAYEELQTSNEELISSTEEMHGIHEELATSTEELQSKNEELLCLTQELFDRQEQLAAMQRYSESIVNTIHEPLLVLDHTFKVVSANPAFHKLTGTNENNLYDKPLFAFNWFEWNLSEIKKMLDLLVSKNIGVDDYKITANFPEAGSRTLIISARQILESKPTSILLTFKDITEKSKSEELMAMKHKELQEINQELGKFSASASHDLQEPLRKTLMFAQMILQDEDLSENSKRLLERITVATERMQNLINDLILYTNYTLQAPPKKNTDLNAIVKKALESVKSLKNEKNATVEIAELPQVKVIPEQMKELIAYLIKNALLYNGSEMQPEIKISSSVAHLDELLLFNAEPNTKYVKISIADNGEGFNDSHALRIFEPFFRLHSKDQIPGSGLGLTMCRRIVKNHNGFITAESKINEGSTFSIFLPNEG